MSTSKSAKYWLARLFTFITLIVTAFLFQIVAMKSSIAKEAASIDKKSSTEIATLAGGCFWCMFPPFAKQAGIEKVTAGYTGGTKQNPSYEEVSSGTTGHVEAVEIVFDPKKISFEKILDRFWKTMDPTDATGQFVDRGTQYRSAIFYHGEEQKKIAEKSRDALQKSKRFGDKKIVTEIKPATQFYMAEDYHQDYYKKSPEHYRQYHSHSGREDFLKEHWKKDALPAED